MKISFVGLGKLGLPIATVLANVGNKILGLDIDEKLINKLNSGMVPFYEPNLENYFPNHNFLRVTNLISQAISETDITLILINSQDDNLGYSSNSLEILLTDLSNELRNNNKTYHMFILSTTVMPGTINKLIRIIEKTSGRDYGKGFGFSYVPDFVKLGSVINDFRNPDFFMIGANHLKDFEITNDIWRGVHLNNPPVKYLTIEESEIAKISLNAYIVSKITFANFLGLLCQDLENVNIHNITDTIGIDKRISPHFFGYGTPYGGTCFPRDTKAFKRFALTSGYQAKNLEFAEEVNELVLLDIVERISKFKKIGIIGLAFKKNSVVTIGSPSISLIESLTKYDCEINVYDSLKETFVGLNLNAIIFESPQALIDKSDVIVIMHPDKSFSELKYFNKPVVDPWGILRSNN